MDSLCILLFYKKKQLSETEKDIDICVRGNIRDLVFSHSFPRAYFHLLPLLLFY